MYCLGIEGTAEKLGVGIVSSEGAVLANVTEYQPLTRGIHPREAAQHHAEKMRGCIKAATKEAGMGLREMGLVAFSQGPGLGPCLRVAAVSARTIALRYSLPLIGVNHCIAHVEGGRLFTKGEDPLTLYVSGGNTQVIAYADGRYRVFGETLDIAVGNCLDQFARGADLKVPGGPVVEQLAAQGDYFPLPYVVKGMDLSFSGLLTAALEAAKSRRIEDVCRSLQETAFSMLVEVTERALAQTRKKEVMLVGGVGVNKRLQEMLASMADEHGVRLLLPPREIMGDNGVMIAWLGLLMHNAGTQQRLEETVVRQRYRTDEVEVLWR